MEFSEAAVSRRSIRRYLNKRIDDDALRRLLEFAHRTRGASA